MIATMTTTPGSRLTWEPPGPGSWTLLADHYARPVTAAYEAFLPVWESATTAYMREAGVPIREARMVLVNGLPYMAFETEGGAGKPPPAWVMKLAIRLLPSLRRIEAKLRNVLEERPWNEGVRRWYEEDRPAAIERMTALTRVDPDNLTDEDLARHLEACYREMLDSADQHLTLHGHDMLPPGLFAVQMVDWGFTAAHAFGLLAGSSPASTGMSDELQALRVAVNGREASSVEELRALGPEVGNALDAFLERHGWRILDGYDIDGSCLIEVPSLVVALATGPVALHLNEGNQAAIAEARGRVPASERGEFDRLLQEAQAAYGLRDDNSGILTSWPAGLLRRAMLACGDRLAARGKLRDARLVIEATPGAITAALRGQGELDSDALVERAAYRRSLRSADAPRRLGPPEPPLPENLPGALGLVMRAIAVLGLGETASKDALCGMGIGSTAYEGRARLVIGAGDGLDTFEAGDVLVAPMTSPSYNVLLAMAGAVVTEEGDALSHAAIMARELALPAVIGAPRATAEIQDGDYVRVDPVSGTVRVLNRAGEPADITEGP